MLHLASLEGRFASFLTELGLVEPRSGHAPMQPTAKQELLLQAYFSGQIEEWAWQEHLAEDPDIAAHFAARTQDLGA